MSGYHCVDYCQNERERCCRNEKDTRQSSRSTSSSRIYTASPSLSLSLSSMELEYSSAPQSYKKPQLLLSDPSPYIVSSGGAEIVMSSITSLCPGSLDTLTNSITQTIEIDAAAETHRRLWTQQSRPTRLCTQVHARQLRTSGAQVIKKAQAGIIKKRSKICRYEMAAGCKTCTISRQFLLFIHRREKSRNCRGDLRARG